MNQSQLVTITFFKYAGLANKWWAFKEMGMSPYKLRNIEGLQFGKMLGSGAKAGFSIWPNFGVYALLCVWDEKENAHQFFLKNKVFSSCKKHSRSWWTIYMKVAQSHGKWNGSSPFQVTTTYNKEELVAVITRATISRAKMWQFWRKVPAVSAKTEGCPGLLFSIGVGEVPLLHQVTFSIWENSHKMMDFAYRHSSHREVVKQARVKGWFKEDLFARLHLVYSEGEPMIAESEILHRWTNEFARK